MSRLGKQVTEAHFPHMAHTYEGFSGVIGFLKRVLFDRRIAQGWKTGGNRKVFGVEKLPGYYWKFFELV